MPTHEENRRSDTCCGSVAKLTNEDEDDVRSWKNGYPDGSGIFLTLSRNALPIP
jgi:hypothetical protein